jgi:hypothetical protein
LINSHKTSFSFIGTAPQSIQMILYLSLTRIPHSLHHLELTPLGSMGDGDGGGGALIFQMESWLGFRRGAGGWYAGTNESMGSVWLGRHPYLFAQGTCSIGQMSH